MSKFCPLLSISRVGFAPCAGPSCALWIASGPIPVAAPDGNPAGTCGLLKLADRGGAAVVQPFEYKGGHNG